MKVILDTNTLLLFLVGTASKDYIEIFKRTENFSKADFDLLIEVLDHAEQIFTTPQVLAETSNLMQKGFQTPRMKAHVWAEFQNFIETTQEIMTQSITVSLDPSFLRLGLTDAFLALLSLESYEILTCDTPLYLEIKSRGHSAINFNHEIDRSMR